MTQPPARSLSEIVQRPVVTVARDVINPGERRGKRRLGIVSEVFDNAGLAAAEILFVPDIDRRHGQFAAGDGDAARMFDIVACRLVEQRFGIGGSKCRGLQIRAAEGGAVEREITLLTLPYYASMTPVALAYSSNRSKLGLVAAGRL